MIHLLACAPRALRTPCTLPMPLSIARDAMNTCVSHPTQIGDEETVTGMLLAGVGNVDAKRSSPNFMVVDSKTTTAQVTAVPVVAVGPRTLDAGSLCLRLCVWRGGASTHGVGTAQIEETFHRFTRRGDIGVIVINQHIAQTIRPAIDAFEEKSPCILEASPTPDPRPPP